MANAQVAPLTWDDIRGKESTAIWEVTITPDQARRIVKATQAADANFRKLADDSRMAALVEAMRRGEWDWKDADPLRLHIHKATGEIVASDGQHRLQAASLARKNLRALVLWGPEWESGLHVDRNRTRNVAQYLMHEYNLKSAAQYVSLARFHLARVLAYHANTGAAYQANAVRDEEIISMVVDRMDDLHWALNRLSVTSARGFNTIGYGTVLFEIRTVDHELASAFHDDMKDPELEPVDPLMAVRRIALARFNSSSIRMNRAWTTANLVKAHNMRHQGQTTAHWRNAGEEIVFPHGFLAATGVIDQPAEAGAGAAAD